MKFFSKRSKRGDTLVEVMLAIVLIGSAIGLSVSSSNRNLQLGLESNQRSQANTVAQSQIEWIRNAYLNNTASLSSYKAAAAFCISSNGTAVPADPAGSACRGYNGSALTVSNTYDSAKQLFTSKVTWESSSNGSGQSEVTLYYKLPS